MMISTNMRTIVQMRVKQQASEGDINRAILAILFQDSGLFECLWAKTRGASGRMMDFHRGLPTMEVFHSHRDYAVGLG